jgi:hypothetical protein
MVIILGKTTYLRLGQTILYIEIDEVIFLAENGERMVQQEKE